MHVLPLVMMLLPGYGASSQSYVWCPVSCVCDMGSEALSSRLRLLCWASGISFLESTSHCACRRLPHPLSDTFVFADLWVWMALCGGFTGVYLPGSGVGGRLTAFHTLIGHLDFLTWGLPLRFLPGFSTRFLFLTDQLGVLCFMLHIL